MKVAWRPEHLCSARNFVKNLWPICGQDLEKHGEIWGNMAFGKLLFSLVRGNMGSHGQTWIKGRGRLKIRCPQGRVGSIPTSGTTCFSRTYLVGTLLSC
ncbi:MAG: hypothetical protein DDT18_01185 [Actinobacteria bacterium]|uniref:Uncharacterized protein n=1 Tax=Candidatus Hakubella thermalkaliphila TaxID=2754717 RepID=A0A6V8PG57_9ACTN|nr:hypothetical protein [Actinomycetota bacterium]GFP31090.1 hypothetical protein HKBW3S34_02009 [Candidatus Hakubella thermalkaliphila]